MKLVPQQCPNCANSEINLTEGQKHCQCQYCGTKFVVEWSDSGVPKLDEFAKILQTTMTNVDFLAAKGQLEHIDKRIQEAQETVNARQAELDQALFVYNNIESEYRNMSNGWAILFWGSIAGTIVGAFLVTFILEDTAWWIFLFITIAAGLAAIPLYLEWKKSIARTESALQQAQPRIDQARANLFLAYSYLQDRLLEKDLCNEQIRQFHYRPGNTGSATTISVPQPIN